jgi:hypothetical protein
MDQIRAALGWLKRQHFWVLCVLVALIGIFCWWRAAGALSAKFAADKSAIETQFSSLSSLQSKGFHPNNDVITQQEKEINNLADDVRKLWEQLYKRQSDGVLKWPDALSQAFRDEVEKMQFGQEIPGELREDYQNYILRHFPKLPEKIGARAIDPETAGAAGGGQFSRFEGGPALGGRGMRVGPGGQPIADDGDYICEWVETDQANVRAELDFPQQPSSLRIWVAQENLWVYHTLLDIIKNTNQLAGATRPSNAAVRTLFYLQVGQPAAAFSRKPGRIYKPPSAAPAASLEAPMTEMPLEGTGEPGAGGEMMPGLEQGRSGLASGSGPMSEAQEQAVFLGGRYLDETGKPIPFGGGAAVDGVAPDPSLPAPAIDTTVFGKEYKRLPVRMVVEMDQRHLPTLIAQCATQPLQVEVQEVRINVPDAVTGDGGMSGAFRGGGVGFDGSSGGSLFPILTGLQEFPEKPHIATVVIQGVIYIFNKPNLELLKVESADGAIAQTP